MPRLGYISFPCIIEKKLLCFHSWDAYSKVANAFILFMSQLAVYDVSDSEWNEVSCTVKKNKEITATLKPESKW